MILWAEFPFNCNISVAFHHFFCPISRFLPLFQSYLPFSPTFYIHLIGIIPLCWEFTYWNVSFGVNYPPLRDATQIDFPTASVKLTLFSDPLPRSPKTSCHKYRYNVFFSLSIFPGNTPLPFTKGNSVTWSGTIILRCVEFSSFSSYARFYFRHRKNTREPYEHSFKI